MVYNAVSKTKEPWNCPQLITQATPQDVMGCNATGKTPYQLLLYGVARVNALSASSLLYMTLLQILEAVLVLYFPSLHLL